MERQLVIGFVSLELQDGSFSREDATFEQIDRREDFIIGHWTEHKIIVVTPGFPAVGDEV